MSLSSCVIFRFPSASVSLPRQHQRYQLVENSHGIVASVTLNRHPTLSLASHQYTVQGHLSSLDPIMYFSVQFIAHSLSAIVALALPPTRLPVAPMPALPTIYYDVGDTKNTLTPLLDKGSDGGVEVGGTGSHDAGVLDEHGTGDAQVGPKGADVCLTQAFVLGVSVLSR